MIQQLKHPHNFKQVYQMRASLIHYLSGDESACQCRRHSFNPCVLKIPWRGTWQPTPVFLPAKSWTEETGRQQPWGCKRGGHDIVAEQQQLSNEGQISAY